MNDTIEISDFVAGLLHTSESLADEIRRISISIFLSIVGEKFPNVTESQRSEQGIGKSVQDNVCVAMSDQMPIEFDFDTAELKGTAFSQSVCVVSDTDAWEVGHDQ